MALFVLGAGATRGASFVNPANNPCLPPLDLELCAHVIPFPNGDLIPFQTAILSALTTRAA
jgi:hypothetical protein